MKLSQAAVYFDKDSVYDGYTNAFLFKAQFSSFDGSQPDGSFQRRRVMSVGPSIVLPVRRSVIVHGERWLAGDLMRDGFFDKVIRATTPCMLVTDTFKLLSPSNAALRTAGGNDIHAHSKYLRDTVDSTRSSDTDPFYEVYMAHSENPVKGYFLKSASKILFIRAIHEVPEGFTVCSADLIHRSGASAWTPDELWDAGAEVSVKLIGAMNPITELPGAEISTTGIIVDIRKLFNLGTEASPLIKNGDRALIIPGNLTQPEAGISVVVESTNWRIQSVQQFYDSWLLHIRRP